MSPEREFDAIIIGAGLAGLKAANILNHHTDNFLLLEKRKTVGGRVSTESMNGFLLDRGFQIFLTKYPEALQTLDYNELDLNSFRAGALIRRDDHFSPMVDPLAHPIDGLQSLTNGIGTMKDRWLTMKLRFKLYTKSVDEILNGPEETTQEFLTNYGFSEEFIETFFRPFLSGVFLESDLSTSSKMFRFVYKMFSEGKATLPSKGMNQISLQMSRRIPRSNIRTNKAVESVETNSVTCVDGETFNTKSIIIATGGWVLDQLDGLSKISTWNETSCHYYSLREPPIKQPMLIINGQSDGIINNLCFPSLVSSNYSPPNRHLLSVSTLNAGNKHNTRNQVEDELLEWFGPVVEDWSHLATKSIPYALPRYTPNSDGEIISSIVEEKNLYLCGDYLETPSINGALASGRKAAERVINELEFE